MSKCSDNQLEKLREAKADKTTIEFVQEYFDIKEMDSKGMLLDPEELDVLQQVNEIADMAELSGRFGTAMVSMREDVLLDVNYNEPRYNGKRITIIDGKYNGNGKAKLLIRFNKSYFWVDRSEIELRVSWDEVLGNEPDSDMQGSFQEIVTSSKINSVEEMNKTFDKVASLDKQSVKASELKHLKNVMNQVLGAGLRVIPEMSLYLDDQASSNSGFISTDAEKMGVYVKLNKEKPKTNSEMSGAEVLVHELVHAATVFAMRYNKGEVSRHIDRLVQLRKEAMKVLAVEDFMPDVVVDRDAEYRIAKKRLEYINDSLEEFLAYAVTNSKVMEKISSVKVYERKRPDKLSGLIPYYLKKAIDAATMLWRKESKSTNGLDVAVNVMTALAKAQDKARSKSRSGLVEALFNKIDDLEESISEKQKAAIDKVASKYDVKFDYNTKGYKRALQYVRLLAASMSSERSTGVLSSLLSDLGMKHTGLISTTIDTLRKGDDLKNVAQELGLQSVQIDEVREATAGKIAGLVVKGFEKKLSKKEKAVLQTGFQRVDASSLVDEDIIDVFISNEVVDRKLEELYTKLPEGKKEYFRYQAQGLAKFMNSGVGNEIQLRNAEAIVRELGSDDANVKGDVDEEQVKVLDKIITLEAIKGLDTSVRNEAIELMRKDMTGVMEFLKLQKALDENIRSSMDFADRVNTKKGYVRETFDGYTNVTVVPLSEKKKMIDKGYKFVRVFEKSALDMSKEELGVFVSNDLIQQPFNRQAVRFIGERHDGLSFFDTAMKSNGPTEWKTARESTKSTSSIAKRANRLLKQGKKFELEGKVTPEFDSAGRIVDYRYNVPIEDKIELLGVEFDGATALGRSVAHKVDVEESEKLNEIVWQELLVDMAKNKGDTATTMFFHHYTELDINSDNAMVRDIARIIPKSFRDNLKLLRSLEHQDGMASEEIAEAMVGSRWKDLNLVEKAKLRKKLAEGKLFVRSDLLIPMFGIRDLTIVNAPGVKQLPLAIKTYIRKLENLWKEFVSLYKVGIIIKTIPVLLGNMVSNLVSGIIAGGTPQDVVNDSLKAWSEIGIYRESQEALIEAQAMLAKTGDEKYSREISRIKNDIESMAIYPLVKYGLYTQILEEVERDTTSNNKIVDFFDRKLERMPEIIQDGVQWAYMTDKTKAFQVIQSVTAKSDFVARYAQYKSVMKRQTKQLERKKGKKLSKEEFSKLEKDVLRDIKDAYINYTRPDHPILQYLNDMGFVLFTKYALRIQRIALNLLSGHPIRAAAALAGQELMFQSVGVDPSDVFEKAVFINPTGLFYSPEVTAMIEKVFEPHLYSAVKSIGDL